MAVRTYTYTWIPSFDYTNNKNKIRTQELKLQRLNFWGGCAKKDEIRNINIREGLHMLNPDRCENTTSPAWKTHEFLRKSGAHTNGGTSIQTKHG
jgi:hypothetical protein